jgi:CheY-like chemotaxis protein
MCRSSGSRADPRGTAVPKPILDNVKILLVDDEPRLSDILEQLLVEFGARVAVADSARAGLAAFSQAVPDILISDINMPDEDGLWLIAAVRRLPPERGGNVPAIAVTGELDPDMRERVLAAGFQEMLTKPVNLDEVLRVVARLRR